MSKIKVRISVLLLLQDLAPVSIRVKSAFSVVFKVLEKEQNFVSDILTFIFDMERVLLQPANSLLQPAKKVRI